MTSKYGTIVLLVYIVCTIKFVIYTSESFSSDRKKEIWVKLTYIYDRAEDRAVFDCGAVPPPVPELPLTLMYSHLSTPTNTGHMILV